MEAAWVYRQTVCDRSLIALEEQARAAAHGLWALPENERQPPWEWRRAGAAQRQGQCDNAFALPDRASSSNSSGYSCSARKSCSQMTSCAEARFQLEQCGNTRLDGNGDGDGDGDGDGVPCESLCR